MDKEKKRNVIIIILLTASFISFAYGVINIWTSLRNFDNLFLMDKDKQVDRQIDYVDAGLKTILNSFYREIESIYKRQTFRDGERLWLENGDVSALKTTLHSSVVNDNSIYYATLVYRDKMIVPELSDDIECTFIKKLNYNNLWICRDQKGNCFMAYRYKDEVAEYYRLISLENLLNDSTEVERNEDDINYLLDRTGTLFIKKEGEVITVEEVSKIKNANKYLRLYYIKEAQKNNKSTAKLINLKNHEKETYSARLKIRPVKETTNEVFTIAETTDYGSATKTNKKIVSGLLYYAAAATIGAVFLIIFLMLLNKTTRNNLVHLAEKNRMMEDVNREMQLLSHHQRLETIGTMTAGIAHEFNNLLTPILGYSMMTMEMYPDEDELQENLTEVYNATLKAKDIVSGLADLSRKGNKESFEKINFDEIIEKSVRVTNPVKPDNVEVIKDLHCSKKYILGDSTQLSQLTVNIMLNAYDAMKPDGGRLSISSRAIKNIIVVEITDTGCGMSAETIAKLFDPFYTTKESGKGTGLGMAISAQIIAIHEAKIYVDSELGKGSTFRLEFKEHRE